MKLEGLERQTAPKTGHVPLARRKLVHQSSSKYLLKAFEQRFEYLLGRQGSRPYLDYHLHCAGCWLSLARRGQRKLGAYDLKF